MERKLRSEGASAQQEPGRIGGVSRLARFFGTHLSERCLYSVSTPTPCSLPPTALPFSTAVVDSILFPLRRLDLSRRLQLQPFAELRFVRDNRRSASSTLRREFRPVSQPRCQPPDASPWTNCSRADRSPIPILLIAPAPSRLGLPVRSLKPPAASWPRNNDPSQIDGHGPGTPARQGSGSLSRSRPMDELKSSLDPTSRPGVRQCARRCHECDSGLAGSGQSRRNPDR